jgi:hypothetical protein
MLLKTIYLAHKICKGEQNVILVLPIEVKMHKLHIF